MTIVYNDESDYTNQSVNTPEHYPTNNIFSWIKFGTFSVFLPLNNLLNDFLNVVSYQKMGGQTCPNTQNTAINNLI